MGSIRSKIELDIVNEVELFNHLENKLEDYRVEHMAPGTRIIVSNKQLVHKIGVVSGEKIKIKTRSRKMQRVQIWAFIISFFIAAAIQRLIFPDHVFLAFFIFYLISAEIIIWYFRDDVYKTMVRGHDRVIAVMREVEKKD